MMIVMKMKTRWQTQAAPARKSISYTLLLIYNHGEEIVERLIWGNNQQATQQQESFTFLYRVVFLTGPPDFQYQKEKQVAANQD